MQFIGAILVLAFCVPVFFFPARLVKPAISLAIIALLLGAFGCFWPNIMPKDFLVANPWAVNSPLHPQMSVFFGGVCLLYGLGILIALGCRAIYQHFNILKRR